MHTVRIMNSPTVQNNTVFLNEKLIFSPTITTNRVTAIGFWTLWKSTDNFLFPPILIGCGNDLHILKKPFKDMVYEPLMVVSTNTSIQCIIPVLLENSDSAEFPSNLLIVGKDSTGYCIQLISIHTREIVHAMTMPSAKNHYESLALSNLYVTFQRGSCEDRVFLNFEHIETRKISESPKQVLSEEGFTLIATTPVITDITQELKNVGVSINDTLGLIARYQCQTIH